MKRRWKATLAAVPCVSETAYMTCAECVDEQTCGVRIAMKEVRDATAKILDTTSLTDILKRVEVAGWNKEALSYSI